MSSVILMGEILLRLTTPDFMKIKEADHFQTFVGGAELNTSVSLSHFGHSVALVSAVPDNDLGDKAKLFLKTHGIDHTFVVDKPGRLGLYFTEEGFGVRPSKVLYDRTGTSVLHLDEKDINWDDLFENRDLLHITGITLALSVELRNLAIRVVNEAKKRGITISFDCNYRSKLWTPEEAAEAYKQILPLTDICFAGQKDFTHILKWGHEKDFSPETLHQYYKKAASEYGISMFACTNRIVHTSEAHHLQGFLYTGGKFLETPSYSIKVLDRIGSGDSFAAGILHGWLERKSQEATLQFGISSCVLKHTTKGDYSSFTEKEINEWIKNSAAQDVLR
ncbi:sugar kinase [Jeotgalibacillus terrae]|uniref:PfkB family carbohydrate kinase n=1 Tax=Jeotgalibacillus terrae TaxID=587735 RepID=A0ABW5ZIR0_9BACL|nr:sugar kinase [Jeotgalibacillus terrae]MBM7579648.1 2-dehydro-3-deoxygluconokinase [Jeotgalibacillus terrae]